jgi:hypothetical protein
MESPIASPASLLSAVTRQTQATQGAESRPRQARGITEPLVFAAAALGVVVRRLDRSWKVGVLCSAAGAAFGALRILVAGHGHVGSLVLVGSSFGHRGMVPHGVEVTSGAGYDGQFYYRMALDPIDFAKSGFGITFDTFGRLDRIGYPALAWLLAVGHGPFVPATMIIVNVVAFGAIAWAAAGLAETSGRQPIWGLLIAGYFGFLWTMARDLTELVAAAGLVAGLLALRWERRLLAALALAVSVLSRETGLVVVGCLAVADLWQLRLRAARKSVTWLVPLCCFAGWQGLVWARTGTLALRASGRANLAQPFDGLAHAFGHYLARLPSTTSLLWCGEIALLLLAGAGALVAWRSSTALLHERLAFIAIAIMTLCLAPAIWLGDVGFRSIYDIYVLSVVIVISSPHRVRALPLLMGAAWIVVAGQLVLFI